MDRYALEFSMVLERCPRGNHLFPGQMRNQHAEAAAFSPETIYPERQKIAVDSTTDRYFGEPQEIPIKGLGIQPKTEPKL